MVYVTQWKPKIGQKPFISEHLQNSRLFFVHGLEGSSQGVKATLLRRQFPGMSTPDFRGSLKDRMVQLNQLLDARSDWVLIGSSLGGLMATIYTCAYPKNVKKLVLLAPALILPEFANNLPPAVSTPTLIYHGSRDIIIPLEAVRPIAEKIFNQLDFRVVDDDHGLYHTVHSIDWRQVLSR